MSPHDTALRHALCAMLADALYPEHVKNRPWVTDRLEEVAWTDFQRTALAVLARRWATTQGPLTVLALRKALGEELSKAEQEALTQRAGWASRHNTESHATQLEATESMNSVAHLDRQDSAMADTTPLSRDDLTLLHDVAEELLHDQQFQAHPKRVIDATKIIEQGRITHGGLAGVWNIVGSKGNHYTYTRDGCTCSNGQKNQTTKYGCAHAVATILLQRFETRRQPSMFPPTKTTEERLAAIPPQTADVAPQATTPPGDDREDQPAPEGLLENPREENEVAMPETLPVTAFPEPAPQPVLTLALPRRSISAIVTDLSRPLPNACVATKAQGGQSIPFLHWQTVARILDAYAPGWHGAVARLDTVGKVCAITYRLTIPCLEGEISREATGQEDEDFPEKAYGDSTSNAEAMAFKRAAAKFGVGQWLYDTRNDVTAQALGDHLKAEKQTALAELGKALDEAGLSRETTITWLRLQTGAVKNTEIPLAAIRALLGHVAGTRA